ncbi:fibronectin type III domain-containing protein, partial [Limosilactobacillus reuteri]|uniref:fibronectin type III domain-containing protein n=1 Tax=Limosilactobacillus reuteri TaxID=1598 RepID=UPI00338E4FB2
MISNVVASNLTANTARIAWSTNENSDSRVEYGTTTSYGITTPLDTALVTSHVVGLTGLNPNSTYQYRVISRDQTGNTQVSGNFVFT